MKANDIPTGVWIAGALVAVVGIYVWRSGGVANAVSGAVGAVGDAGVGAVVGAGQLVGIPATNSDQCGRDLAAGDRWAASFSCPAGRFVGSVFGGAERPVDNSVMDRWDSIARRAPPIAIPDNRSDGAGIRSPEEDNSIDAQLGDYSYYWNGGNVGDGSA